MYMNNNAYIQRDVCTIDTFPIYRMHSIVVWKIVDVFQWQSADQGRDGFRGGSGAQKSESLFKSM